VVSHDCELVNNQLSHAKRVRLFLDYDGTLADFAPTPDHINPDPEIIDILTRLAEHPCIRVAVVSGRRLSHVAQLIPVPGVMLAGTYGIELQTPQGKRINRVSYDIVRPALDDVKPRWLEIISDCQGFFLEDKGWTLALHARFAEDGEAEKVLAAARQLTKRLPTTLFRVLGGHKFLEIGPRLAHKGQTVVYLLENFPWSGALSVYMGDDDKDEEAFEVIRTRGGLNLLIAREQRRTQADLYLESPKAARQWLKTLLRRLDQRDCHPGE
jgi:trehalose 6-phosphate phosphatase